MDAVLPLRTCPPKLDVVLGTAAGLIALTRDTSTTPIQFSLAVAILATTAAILASLPPAAYAATRDPVTVMRTP